MKNILSILFLSVFAVFIIGSNAYSQYSITQLSNDPCGGNTPQINDNGYVVWSGSCGTEQNIFLYNGSTTTQLTNDNYNDYYPQINNNNNVVWYKTYSNGREEIFLYDGSTTTQNFR